MERDAPPMTWMRRVIAILGLIAAALLILTLVAFAIWVAR